MVEVEAEFGSVQFNIGQGLIHSMSRAVSMLMDVHGAWQKQDPMEYYIICNNTLQSLCFGQVCSTDVSQHKHIIIKIIPNVLFMLVL